MNIPASAADSTPESKEQKREEEKSIMALVNGERIYFTKKEALSLASKLIISVEVSLDRERS